MIAPSIQDKIERDGKSLESRQSKMLAVFALFMLSGVFAASVIFSLPHALPNEPYFTVCGFKNFTGLPCPGCGLTHSFCALGKGDVTAAFGFNLLGPPLFLAFVLLWVRSAGVLLKKEKFLSRFDRMAERLRPVRAFLVAFAVFGVARIIYLLIYYPQLAQGSAMMKLVGRLFN